MQLKRNTDDNLIELYDHNDNFLAGWEHFDMKPNVYGRIQSMLEEAFKAGKRAKAKEIREALEI